MKIKTLLAMGLCAAIGLMSVSAFAAERVSKQGHDEWEAPPLASRKTNPIPSDEKTIGLGKSLYAAACLACHGEKGKGDGPAAPALERDGKKILPGNLSDSKMMWGHTDGALFWKISEGRSPMPSFAEAFTETQRWDIVTYVRTLAMKPPGTPAGGGEAVQVSAVSQVKPPVKAETKPPQLAAPASTDKYVTREEYEQLRKQFETVQSQLEQLTGQRAPAAAATPQTGAPLAAVTIPALKEETTALSEELRGVKKAVSDLKSGTTTKSLLTGYAFAGYTDQKGGSSFNAGFNPIFLWQPAERLFFESELELGLAEGETDVDLEYAHLTYLLNDYVTLGAGKFLTPFGIFRERLHPAWINKLPDAPMAFGHHGLIPPSTLGVDVRGGFPVATTKLNYSLYLGNGPRLNVGKDEPGEAGLLHFDNFDDFRDSKAAGARVGFLPIPELEIGYSGQYAQLDATGTSQRHADSWLHGPYVSYVRSSDLLRGDIDVKAEWVWSQVDRLTYDPTGSLGFGPTTFDNRRNGGYAQLAYRPSKVSMAFVQNLEGVFRWDVLDRPGGAPENADESRYTFGLNYWLSPRVVFKGAYQFGDRKEPGKNSESISAFLLQAAMGF